MYVTWECQNKAETRREIQLFEKRKTKVIYYNFQADKLCEATKLWLDDQEDLMVVRNSSAANKKEFFKIMISNELPLVMDEKTDLEPTNYALKKPIFLSLYLIYKIIQSKLMFPPWTVLFMLKIVKISKINLWEGKKYRILSNLIQMRSYLGGSMAIIYMFCFRWNKKLL